MNSDDLDKRIDALAEAALLKEPDKRNDFLTEECGQDRELLSQVEHRISMRVSSVSENSTRLAADSSSDLPWIGRSLAHYRITGQLGRGGMGEVYLAKDIRLNREVALKLLPREAIADESRRRRFFQEARAASTLNHPNIVTIFDIGEHQGVPFIATELIHGRTLRTIIEERPALGPILRIIEQVAKALAVAHRSGIVHRDIKPDNIMVRDDGYAKILDFGLARLLTASGSDTDSRAGTYVQTSAGIIVGTLAYMSPEQAQGEAVTPATDIFSLGVVLFEAATGQHPFRGDSRVGLLNAIVSQNPVPPSRLNPEVTSSVETTILRMLEKEAGNRPSAAEVEESLAALRYEPGAPGPALKVEPTKHTVGRELERSQLQSCFDQAERGRGQVFCVSGEPGIGKTTLVEEFLAQLHSQGNVGIARGRCSERLAGAEAYLPLIEALEDLQNDPRSPKTYLIKALAPTWYNQLVTLSPDRPSDVAVLSDIKSASQERLKREMFNLLAEASRARPLVLFLDDLHWADDSTTSMLAYLANKFDATRLLIIAAYRPSDLILSKHPFLQVKLDLQTRGRCTEIQLDFLTSEEVARYIRQEFHNNRFPPELAAMIFAKTEGSPLFMSDLVRYLRDQEIIAEQEETWVLTREMAAIEAQLPESVRSMIQKKIDQLNEEDRRLLVAASVQGYNFDSSVLSQASGVESSEVEERLEELQRVHSFVRLIDEHEFPDRTVTLRYRFVHVLYQNALYSSLKPTRRAALNSKVANALLSFYGRRATLVALDLAHHFEIAREFPRAADFYLAASQGAFQVFANPEAQALANRGINALSGVPESVERDRKELMLQLTLAAAAVAGQTAASTSALTAYSRARDLCLQLGEDRMLFNVRFGLFWCHLTRGESEKAKTESEAVLELANKLHDEALLVEAHHLAGMAASHGGYFDEARSHLESSVTGYRADQQHTPGFLFTTGEGLVTRATLARVLRVLGYPDQAKKLADETRRQAANSSYYISRGLVLLACASLCREFEGPNAVLGLAEELIALANDFQTGVTPWGTLLRGWARAEMGETEGITEMRDSLIEQAKTGSLGPSYSLLFVGALLKAGLIQEAEAAINDTLKLAERINERAALAEMYRVMGEIMVARAEEQSTRFAATPRAGSNEDGSIALFTSAETWFQRALELARIQNAKLWELMAATSLSRLYLRQDRKEEALQLLSGVYNWFTEGFDMEPLKEAKAMLDKLGRPM